MGITFDEAVERRKIEAQKPKREKTCITCKSFRMTMQESNWSENTPGSDFSAFCMKDIWTFEIDSHKYTYRECLLKANECEHYDYGTEEL